LACASLMMDFVTRESIYDVWVVRHVFFIWSGKLSRRVALLSILFIAMYNLNGSAQSDRPLPHARHIPPW
jgi:hypothetical protein